VAHKIITLIPARGGSKRIPKKNIRLLAGKPLLQYTIDSAKEAGLTRIIVSTDCPSIAKLAIDCGAEVPFIRPKKLAEDQVLDFPVVEHCLDYFEEHENFMPDLLVFLRPTMPFRTANEIVECIEIIESNLEIDCVRTVSPVPYTPFLVKAMDESGFLEPFCEEVRPYQYMRAQDIPETFICDGYVDVTKVSVIRKFRQVVAGKTFAYQRKNNLFVDLDEEKDWQYAEYLIQKSFVKQHEH